MGASNGPNAAANRSSRAPEAPTAPIGLPSAARSACLRAEAGEGSAAESSMPIVVMRSRGQLDAWIDPDVEEIDDKIDGDGDKHVDEQHRLQELCSRAVRCRP